MHILQVVQCCFFGSIETQFPFPPLVAFWAPAEAGGEREASSAHQGAATARAETPAAAPGAAGGGADSHGQHRLHPLFL